MLRDPLHAATRRDVGRLPCLAILALLAVNHDLCAQTTLTLAPVKDTYLQDIAPTSNFGASEELLFGRGVSFGLGNIRTLVEFDLTALPHANVKQAVFSAWQFKTEPAAGTIECRVQRCTTAWTETGATWATAPAYDTKIWGEAQVGDGPFGWVDWTVTDLVRAQAAGLYPALGWLFKTGSDTAGISRLGHFHSREYVADPTKRPKLVVEMYDLDLAVAQPSTGIPTPITVDRAEPNQAVVLAIDFTKLGLTPIVRLGVVFEMHDPSLLAILFADATGTVQASVQLPAAASGVPFWIQAAAVGKLSNVVPLVAL